MGTEGLEVIQELSVLTNALSKSIATIKKIVVKFALQGDCVCVVKNIMVFFEGTVVKAVMTLSSQKNHYTSPLCMKELSVLR